MFFNFDSDPLSEAMNVIEQALMQPGVPVKIPVTTENEATIQAVIEQISFHERRLVDWKVLGAVGGKGVFCVSAIVQQAKPADVIVVDFKAKKVLYKAS